MNVYSALTTFSGIRESLQMSREFVHNPHDIGSMFPSSPALADAICAAVLEQHPKDESLFIELGAGTGAITQKLLTILPNKNLIAVEQNRNLAEKLAKRFPELSIRKQPMQELRDIWDHDPRPKVMISSLPFRSIPGRLSLDIKKTILTELARHSESILVQYSYGLSCPISKKMSRPGKGVVGHLQGTVWLNLPPARIWVYRQSKDCDTSPGKGVLNMFSFLFRK